mgnify:CR=1 FL=1
MAFEKITEKSEESSEMKQERILFKKELLEIRECAVRSIRSGKIIVLEYLFKLFELNEFEMYLVILSLCCEMDHNLKMIFSSLKISYI